MKKSLIPILSLLFIISLDSCKKDSDKQPEEEPEVADTTRVVKIHNSYSGGSDTYTTIFEYDQSGRIIKIKDSSNGAEYFTISYNGDEATFKETPSSPNFHHMVRYKLNSNHQPAQRISVESSQYVGAPASQYAIFTDTLRYEYDAAGLLVKATGAGYDSTWNNYSGTTYRVNHKVYTYTYTNKDSKLMSAKSSGLEDERITNSGGTSKSATQTDVSYTFEYTKNYANKADVKNAWVFAELDLLYAYQYPMIKGYANFPDKIVHSSKRTDLASGNVYGVSEVTSSFELEYTPAGYISTFTTKDGSKWDKYLFTYNK
jgi:hypothetical protein